MARGKNENKKRQNSDASLVRPRLNSMDKLAVSTMAITHEIVQFEDEYAVSIRFGNTSIITGYGENIDEAKQDAFEQAISLMQEWKENPHYYQSLVPRMTRQQVFVRLCKSAEQEGKLEELLFGNEE